MEDITAIILAAGQGLRLGKRGHLVPKGLLKLGSKTLIEDSVIELRKQGVKRIRIVTGHLANMYEALFSNDYPGVELKHNPDFDNTGSLNSLVAGLDGIDGPVLIVESDLTYEPRALMSIDGRTSRLIVSGPTGAGDEVYVWAKSRKGTENGLLDMSKNLHALPQKFFGELVGITCLSAPATAQLKSLAPAICSRNPNADYENGLVQLASQSGIACHLIDDLAWAEIDDEAMFERALKLVFPSIQSVRDNCKDLTSL